MISTLLNLTDQVRQNPGREKMSLTALIKSDKDLGHKISSAFSRPKLEKNKPLLAEPLTKNYVLFGTAFDYIFRFFLEKINNSSNPSQVWIAERGIERGY